jgi:hypothetical protein
MENIPDTSMKDNIYSIVPDEVKGVVDMTLKNKLKKYLAGNKGAFYNSKYLTDKFGFKKSSTNVELRQVITELIVIDGCPIVSNTKGYAWAACDNQIRFYIDNLEDRKQGIQRRINSLMRLLVNVAEQIK